MLFKKMESVLQYAQMTNNVAFASVSNTIANIEAWHLVPILGKEQYADLESAYQLIILETSLSTAHQNLLEYCRRVIGSFLCYYYTPKAAITLSDAGTRRLETEQAKTAYQYQITDFREQHLREAEQHCESLFEFLDDNQSSYELWVSSKAFSQYRKLFIKSAKEFNENYTTHSPYRNYWAMRFKMVDVEAQLVKIALTKTLFNTLKTKDLNAPDTFTDEETELLDYIKKSIAYFTVAFSLPYVSVRFDTNGITVTSQQGTTSNDALTKMGDAGDTKISKLINQCASDGRMWLKTATDFINANLSAFPTFELPEKPVEDNRCDGNEALEGIFGMV